MIITNFNENELQYIKGGLVAILTSNDEAEEIMREDFTEQDIKEIKHFIDSTDMVNVTEDENKRFIDVIYNHLGLWCFEDAEYTYEELFELLEDKQFCEIYKKLVLDKEE